MLEQVNKPYIVRRLNAGVPNGKGGYTDVTEDVGTYYGRARHVALRTDPTDMSSQGITALNRTVLIFDNGPYASGIDMNVGESDIMLEGIDDGFGNVTVNPNGESYEITNVRKYDRTTQIEVKSTDG